MNNWRVGPVLGSVCPLATKQDSAWLEALVSNNDPRSQVIDLLLKHDREALSGLLPLLKCLRGPAPTGELQIRSANRLQQEGFVDWESICTLTPHQIGEFRNAGRTTVRDILRWCLVHAELVARNGPSSPSLQPDAIAGTQVPSIGPDIAFAWPTGVVEGMQAFLRASRDLNGSHSLADALNDSHIVELLVTLGLQEEFSRIPIGSLLESDSTMGQELISSVEHALSGLSSRDLAILTRRSKPEPDTLDAIGKDLGITRERVRQIGAKVAGTFDEKLNGPLAAIAAAISRDLGPIPAASSVTERVKKMLGSAESPAADLAAQLLLSELGYLELGEFAVNAVGEELRSMSKELAVSVTDDVGIIDSSAHREFFGYLSDDEYAALIMISEFHEIEGHLAIRDTLRVRVKAAVLAIGRPATKEEIQEAGKFTESFGGTLSNIESIARADKERWGLIEWIDDVYEGIPREIQQRIDEHGGAVPLPLLLEELPRMFGVSEASVRSYVATNQFAVNDGMVSVADPSTIRFRHIDDVADRNEDGVLYWDFPMDDRYLDGYSLLGFPPELAKMLGCEPNGNTKVMVASPEGCGEVSVTWRLSSVSGPSVGYLTCPLTALNAGAGDVVRMMLFDVGTVGFELAGGDGEGTAVDTTSSVLDRIKNRRKLA